MWVAIIRILYTSLLEPLKVSLISVNVCMYNYLYDVMIEIVSSYQHSFYY